MLLKDALEQQAEISVNNAIEKATVINILTVNGIEFESLLLKDGDYISLFRLYNSWGFCNSYDSSFPMVSAIDFIKANTPQDPTKNVTYSTPTPESMNII